MSTPNERLASLKEEIRVVQERMQLLERLQARMDDNFSAEERTRVGQLYAQADKETQRLGRLLESKTSLYENSIRVLEESLKAREAAIEGAVEEANVRDIRGNQDVLSVFSTTFQEMQAKLAEYERAFYAN